MPRELNSPILIPQLLVGLWSTLRLVAGSAPVGVAGRGGRRCGRGSCQAQVGEGGGGRRDVAQMTGQSLLQGHASILGKERTPSPVEASLRLGQWLEGLD